MSRGLGRLEQFILQKVTEPGFRGEIPTAHVSAWNVMVDCFPQTAVPGMMSGRFVNEKAARKAAVRAMHSFVRKFPQYGLMGGKGRSKLYLYDRTDPISVRWAQLNSGRKKRGHGSFFSRAEAIRHLAEHPDELSTT